MTEDTIKRRARGLDRAFDILDFLKEIGQPLRPNDIASGIGSPKSTVYELVASLLVMLALVTLVVQQAVEWYGSRTVVHDAPARTEAVKATLEFIGERLFACGEPRGKRSNRVNDML